MCTRQEEQGLPIESSILNTATHKKECFLETQRVTYPAQSHANVTDAIYLCFIIGISDARVAKFKGQ